MYKWDNSHHSYLHLLKLRIKLYTPSLTVPPLRMKRKGLGNVAYTTCTRWNASLVTRRSLHKRVLAINTTCLCEYLISIIIMDALCVGCGENLSLKPKVPVTRKLINETTNSQNML